VGRRRRPTSATPRTCAGAGTARRRLSPQRFCLFVTTEPTHCVQQYDQPSPNTLWYSYPPFFLANAYEFRWLDHGRAGRSLVVAVPPQPTG